MNRHALSDAEWENIRDIAEYKPKAVLVCPGDGFSAASRFFCDFL